MEPSEESSRSSDNINPKDSFLDVARCQRRLGKCFPWCRKQKTRLYLFDFDDTIVQGNSERIYRKVVAEKLGIPDYDVPPLPDHLNWHHMSSDLVDYIFEHFEVTLDEILKYVRERIEFVRGVDIALQTLYKKIIKKNKNAKLVILSGSNELFIKTKLETIGVVADDIVANHAKITPDGKAFKYIPNNYNDGEGGDEQVQHHHCQFCGRGYCKGLAFERYVRQHGRFNIVHFVCDGYNDLCVCIRLEDRDIVYIRNTFSFDYAFQTTHDPEGFRGSLFCAEVRCWDNGQDLMDFFIKPGFCGRRKKIAFAEDEN